MNILREESNHNSKLGRTERLHELPRDVDGALPSAQVPPLDFPSTLECLLVAGNETLPSGGNNSWNKKKTIHLLRFYGEDEETDNEDEHSSASRTRRLRLSRKLGISLAQLNFGLLQM